MAQPLMLVTLHSSRNSNSRSALLSAELARQGLAPVVLDAEPREDMFAEVARSVFPLIDGPVAVEGKPKAAWMRVSASGAPGLFFSGMRWCYVIGPEAIASPDNLTQCAEEIIADAQGLAGKKPQSAIQVPVPAPALVSRRILADPKDCSDR